MDTLRSSYDPVLINSLALESCDEAVDPSVGARAQPIDELIILAEQLARDSTWNWLGPLAALLKDIYRTSCAHQFSGTATGGDAHGPAGSCEQAAAEAIDQIPCVVQRYRALVSLNTALAKALSAIRTSLAHVDGVPPAPRSSLRRGLTRWQERRATTYLLEPSRNPHFERRARRCVRPVAGLFCDCISPSNRGNPTSLPAAIPRGKGKRAAAGFDGDCGYCVGMRIRGSEPLDARVHKANRNFPGRVAARAAPRG